ncbi:hypothetical protein EYF80_017601 [Liparis tanakae]|uniref:Uncharacterized protein n=1 Tax=Liparis tanakae TaxID=230148 RepID=A0A4Z2I4L0_9TELE|nr:hypothetical protein EYF80_017601 [Liparis tanakae]
MLPPDKPLELSQQSEISTAACRTDHVCPYANDPCPQQQPVAPPAEGERQDNYPDKGSSVPGCSPSGASPSGVCRLELVSSPPPVSSTTSTTTTTTTTSTTNADTATAFSMHFVSSLWMDQEMITMKYSKEAEAPDDGQGADPRPRGDLSCHLQTDLHNLQRVGEDHLGATGLEGQKDDEDSKP